MAGLLRLLEELVEALREAATAVEEVAALFFAALVQFLEDLGNWLQRVARAIADYLVRFFTALGKLLIGLSKLGLFYVPSIVALIWAILGGGIPAVLTAVVWALFITGIAVAYGRKK